MKNFMDDGGLDFRDMLTVISFLGKGILLGCGVFYFASPLELH